MEIETHIVNKVADSGLFSFDLSSLRPAGERVSYDITQNLFQGLILREKDFRLFLSSFDFSTFKNKYVALCCSADAIVPQWAYMLLASRLQPFAKEVYFGSMEAMEEFLFQKEIMALPLAKFENQKVVLKGCGEENIPVSALVAFTTKVLPVVSSLMYGEPCSTVPIFKNKK